MKNLWKNLAVYKFCHNFALATPRDGAVVARWAHNPKVRGSSPLPATEEDVLVKAGTSFFAHIWA